MDLEARRYAECCRIADEVKDLPPPQREAAVRERCGDDTDLYEEVRRHLEQLEEVERDGFLNRPPEDTLTIAVSRDDDTVHGPQGKWIGRRIGDYELVEQLGQGGMGVVYKARQTSLNRLVAVKMILSGHLSSEEEIRRFRAEAEAAAHLQHPNIVAVHEVGRHDGQHFFSMEYIEGRGLDRVIRDKPLAPRYAAKCVRQIAIAIDYAHQRGVLHRDLKPANVILQESAESPPSDDSRTDGDSSRGGRSSRSGSGTSASGDAPNLKVTDFGLAKRLSQPVSVTGAGQVLGTPSYMPPEQAEGNSDAVGPRSDVYSIGAILYALVTGRPPFLAEGMAQTLRQVIEHEPLSPRRFDATIPRDLETICLKCLAKSPHRRYGSAGDLAEDLQRFLDGLPIVARPISTHERVGKWVRRRPLAAGLLLTVAVVTVAGLAGVMWQWRAARQNAAEAQRQLLQVTLAAGTDHLEQGDLLAALPWYARALELESKKPDAARIHRLRLAAVLRRTPFPLRTWTHDGPVQQATFVNQDRWVVVATSHHVHVLDIERNQPVCPPLVHESPLDFVRFLPKSKRLITVSQRSPGEATITQRSINPDKYLASLGIVFENINNMFLVTAVIPGSSAARDGRFQPGDRLLGIGQGETEPIVSVDGMENEEVVELADGPVGEVVRLRLIPRGSATAVVCKLRRGKEVIVESRPRIPSPKQPRTSRSGGPTIGTLQVWDVQTGKRLQTAKLATRIIDVVVEPAGERWLTAHESSEVLVWRAGQQPQVISTRRLSDQRSLLRHVAFHPDGEHLLIANRRRGLETWNLNGGAAVQPVYQLPRVEMMRSVIGPDGNRLAAIGAIVRVSGNDVIEVRRVAEGVAGLWELGQTTPTAALRHGGRINDLTFDLTGRRLVTASDDLTARVWNAADGLPIGELMVHDLPVRSASFSPDGRHVITTSYQVGSSAGMGEVRLWDPRTGRSVMSPIRHAGGAVVARFDSHGRRLLTAGRDRVVRIWDLPLDRPLDETVRGDRGVRAATFTADGSGVVLATVRDGAGIHDTTTASSTVMDPAGRMPRHDTYSAISTAQVSHPVLQLMAVDLNQPTTRWRVPVPANGFLGLNCWFSADGAVAVTTAANTAQIWRIAEQPKAVAKLAHSYRVGWVAISGDGRYVATASNSRTANQGEIRLWNAATGEPLGPVRPYNLNVTRLAFSPDGRLLAASLCEGRYGLRGFEAEPTGPRGIAHPDENGLFASGAGTALVLNTADLTEVARWNHAGPLRLLQFGRDGRRLVSVGDDGKFAVWKPGGEPVTAGTSARIGAARLSNDGRRLLIAGDNAVDNDHAVTLWNVDAQTTMATWKHATAVSSLAFDRGSEWAAIVHGDQVDVRTLPSGSLWRSIVSPGAEYVALSDDRRLLAIQSVDAVIVWDLETASPITPPLPHSRVNVCWFNPNGDRLLTCGYGNTVNVWNLADAGDESSDLIELAEFVAGRRVNRAGRSQLLPVDRLRRATTNAASDPRGRWQLDDDQWRRWHGEMAAVREREQQWSAAAYHLGRVIASRPRDAALRMRRGELHAKAGDFRVAIDDFSFVIELDSSKLQTTALRSRARAYEATKQWQEATADYDRLVKLYPKDWRLLQSRATARAAQGDHQGNLDDLARAIELCRAEADSQEYVWQLTFNRTLSLSRLERFAEAIEQFQIALDLGGKYRPEPWLHKGLAHFETGDMSGAIECLSRAALLGGDDLRLWSRRAEALMTTKRMAPAAEDLTRALERSPRDVKLWKKRAQCYHDLARWNEAVNDYDQVLRLVPKDGFTRFNRAVALAKLKRWADVVSECSRAIDQGAAKHWQVWLYRGQARIELGEFEAALTDLQEARRRGAAKQRVDPLITRAQTGLSTDP